jgi:hypothetical protein
VGMVNHPQKFFAHVEAAFSFLHLNHGANLPSLYRPT